MLRAGGAAVGRPDWLAPEVACDIPFDGPALALGMTGIDAVFLPSDGRRKKLLMADMESTVIENEMLDELADFLGLRDKIAAITALAMNGEIDFAGALADRVGLLNGLPAAKLNAPPKRIPYIPAGTHLVPTVQRAVTTSSPG